MAITIESVPTWRDIARVAGGEDLALSAAAWDRVELASRIVERIVESGVRAYGVNTGVGALSDIVIDKAAQIRLSRNIIFSHACGVGELLGPQPVRAIIASQIANLAHGHFRPCGDRRRGHFRVARGFPRPPDGCRKQAFGHRRQCRIHLLYRIAGGSPSA
jgi:hypothetical protein